VIQYDDHPTMSNASGPNGSDQPPQAPPASPTENRAGPTLIYDGKITEILILFLTNVVLNILTFGFYRFWGKTRIRRYVWSHMRLDGDRFEYCGTGLEIFISFMIILVIFYVPFIGLVTWIALDPPYETPQANAITINLVILAGILVIFFLYYVAIFAAYRYRISRTVWRGLRGNMWGSPWIYGCIGAGLGMLNVLSLGWTKPWADAVVFRYRMQRAGMGDAPFKSKMGCGGMYIPYLVAWMMTAIVVIVAYSVIFAVLFAGLRSGKKPTAEELAWVQYANLFGYLLILLAWQLASPWYKKVMMRNIAGTLRFRGGGFRADFTTAQLYWLKVPNFFLLLFTLGLAFPYTIHRTARFAAYHVSISTAIDPESLQRGAEVGPRFGDGLAEFVGIGGL
jgi:uncharacterized membrane protein YjgN (DUF898 family)